MPPAQNWLTTTEAAVHLRQDEVTLRRRLARHARITPEGTVAEVDGLVARKSGSRWLIWLSPAWNPSSAPVACGPPADHYDVPIAESAGPGSRRRQP
jgi:hypothetical protein